MHTTHTLHLHNTNCATVLFVHTHCITLLLLCMCCILCYYIVIVFATAGQSYNCTHKVCIYVCAERAVQHSSLCCTSRAVTC